MDALKQAYNKTVQNLSQENSTKAIVILPYTPQSDLEAELEIGDYVNFEKNKEVDDEWVHGKLVSVERGERWALIPRHCIKFI